MVGTVGILIVVVSAMVLVPFGSAGQATSNWLSILPLLWMLLAPTLGMLLPVQRTSGQHKSFAYLLAGLLFLVSVVAGFFCAELSSRQADETWNLKIMPLSVCSAI